MRHIVSLSILLAAFWLLNSGQYSVLTLSFGALSVALVVLISHRMDTVDRQSRALHWTLRMPGYWLWLCKEIVRANIDVVNRIWRGHTATSPAQFTLQASQKTEIGRVIYANSITLTPGTVAIDLDGDTITVHALSQHAAAELLSGAMDRRISRLED
jgi:multicomponent Na+:H+ antiporter subunit E